MSSLPAIFLLAFHLAGCAAPEEPIIPRVSESERRTIRSVAVAPGRFTVPTALTLPAKGAEGGAARGTMMGIGTAWWIGGPGIILTAPIGAAVGAAVGAASALPAAVVEENERIVRAAFLAIDLHALLAAAVGEGIAAQTGHLVIATIAGPANPGELPAYGKVTVADAVVEVVVPRVGLVGDAGIDPSIEFVLDARARLLRSSDDRSLWDRPLSYRGSRMTLAEWSARDAGRLREQIDLAIAMLAERIVDDLFLLHVPPSMSEKTK